LLSAKILDLTPQEVTAILLQQVGHIFSYIEYLTSTTNATKILADTFLKERFGKSKDSIDSLKLALESTDTDTVIDLSTPVKTLESLDMFILKTYRVDESKNSIKIDFQRLSDQFATRFGTGDDVATLIVKLARADIIVHKDGTSSFTNSSKEAILTILSIITAVIATVLFSIVGLLIFVTYLTIRLISYMFALVSKFISKMFSLILTRGTDRSIDLEDLPKRLTKIKLELIRELRTSDVSDSGRELLLEQVDTVKYSIKQISEKISNLSTFSNSTTSLNYSKMEDINFLTESLQENELYIMQEKFNLKG